MEPVEKSSMMEQTSSLSATSRMFAVLSNTTMSSRNMSSLLSIVLQTSSLKEVRSGMDEIVQSKRAAIRYIPSIKLIRKMCKFNIF